MKERIKMLEERVEEIIIENTIKDCSKKMIEILKKENILKDNNEIIKFQEQLELEFRKFIDGE